MLRPSRPLLAAAIATLALSATVRGDAPPALPGPAPQARAAGYDAAAENAGCEGCHEEIAAEWRGSLQHDSSIGSRARRFRHGG